MSAMKTATRGSRRLFLPLLVALASAPLQAAARSIPGAAIPAVREDKSAEFREKFDAALRIKDTAKMGALIRQYGDEAVNYVIDTAESIANAPNDTFFARMDGLREGWNLTMKTPFVDNMERYFSLLDPAMKRERQRLKDRYFKRRESYFEAARLKDKGTLGVLGLDFEELATAFEQVDDLYFASDAWALMGQCYDEGLRGNSAELERACKGFKKCITNRDTIGLQDRLYKETNPRLEWLVNNGFDDSDPAGGPGGSVEPIAKAPPVSAALKFEVYPDLTRVTRPNYYLDDFYPIWTALGLQAKGSSTEFGRLTNGPKVLRESSSVATLDFDGDNVGEQPLSLKGKLALMEFELGEGNEKHKWACQYITGTDKDIYQGIQINLQPTDEYLTIYLAPAASVVGELAGTPIRIVDEDLDGAYGGAHRAWGNIGLTLGAYQPEFDSLIVGSETVARPWSKMQKVGEQWYELETDGRGLALSATPVDVKTGKLKLKYKGPKPTYLIVKGSGKLEDSYFNVTSAGSEVPVGRYELYIGELRQGKKLQAVKSLIMPSESTQRWNVEEAGTTEIVLGEPYGFDFSYKVEGDDIVVDGKSVVVVGVAGERYERPWGCVPRPEVAYRKADAKRGSKPEKMGLVPTLTDSTLDYKYADTWRPLSLTLKKKENEEKVEVQLTEKKNKLFGKIESDWKGM